MPRLLLAVLYKQVEGGVLARGCDTAVPYSCRIVAGSTSAGEGGEGCCDNKEGRSGDTAFLSRMNGKITGIMHGV